MNDVAWLVGAIAVGLVSGAGGGAIMLARARRGDLPLDLPDPRRLHAAPTPRGGGLGLALAGVAVLPLAMAATAAPERRLLWVGVLVWALPNALLGLVDDHRSLATSLKLAVQLGAATAAVALGLRIEEVAVPPLGTVELGAVAAPFCVLWLVWMANAFNFMDGMDALAAECGAIFFGGMAALALLGDAAGHGAVALAMAAALLGFLRYNAAPARIFMGDVGSLFTGAVLGGLALSLARSDTAAIPLSATAVLLGSFAFDATFTVVRRAARGLALRPHRTHFYQRLALAGWPHRRVRALYVGLTLGGVAGGLVLTHGPAPAQGLALGAIATALLSTVAITRRAERRARTAARQRT